MKRPFNCQTLSDGTTVFRLRFRDSLPTGSRPRPAGQPPPIPRPTGEACFSPAKPNPPPLLHPDRRAPVPTAKSRRRSDVRTLAEGTQCNWLARNRCFAAKRFNPNPLARYRSTQRALSAFASLSVESRLEFTRPSCHGTSLTGRCGLLTAYAAFEKYLKSHSGRAFARKHF